MAEGKNTTLIITEKPQAAEKIAAALSGSKDEKITNKDKISYYQFYIGSRRYIVGCAVGHLYGVGQKEARGPFPNFDIEWKPSFEKKKSSFTKKYLSLLKSLAKESDEFIVATDFDVEGEVIGWNVVRFLCGRKDAKRMKFSSLTTESLKESFENLLPTLNWGAAYAGETRHYIDWYYGINLSRGLMKALTLVGRFKILSIGRVQGPALKILVDKEKEIRNFKSEPYWQVFLQVKDIKNQKIEVKHPKDIFNESELLKFKHLEGKKGQAETKIEEERLIPPHPFDLTTLQTECYKHHGLTPSQTMKVAQSLYLDGVISYPRTSSQKYPKGIGYEKILTKLKKYTTAIKHVVRAEPIQGAKEDPAHPAIYPTGESKKLGDLEKKVYDLIVKRFISCFCDDALIENKKIKVMVNGLDFTNKGVKIKEKGWMNVYPSSIKELEVPTINGEVDVREIRTEEKQTQPPRRYSAASLVKELEKRNLGTKATRSSIVETLYTRGYVKEKNIEVSELGMKMEETLEKYSPIILDEKLTSEMNEELEQMETKNEGLEKTEEKLLNEAKKIIIGISSDMTKNLEAMGKSLSDANEAVITQEREDNTMTTCRVCNKGRLRVMFGKRFSRYFVSCDAYPECKTIYSLPPKGMMKPARDKEEKVELCVECNFPMIMSLQKGRAPWKFCFNPKCKTNEELQKKKEEFKVKLASGEITVSKDGKFLNKEGEEIKREVKDKVKTGKKINGKKDSTGKFVGTKSVIKAKSGRKKKVVEKVEETIEETTSDEEIG